MKTGDLLICSGRGFLSSVTKLTTWSKWSHCGIIMGKSFFHSQKDNRATPGVRLDRLEDFIKPYEGEIWHRELLVPLSYSQLWQQYLKYRRYGPVHNIMKIVSIPLKIPYGAKLGNHGVLCSELIARIYQAYGIFPSGIPHWVTPKDLTESKYSFLGEMRRIK